MEVPSSVAAPFTQWVNAAVVSSVDALFAFLSNNPVVRGIQVLVLLNAVLLVFLVFFATRDIIHRTRSLLLQLLCIVLVAVLPGVGFLLYLLVRPRKTLDQRELEEGIQELLRSVKEMVGKEKFPISNSQFPDKSQVTSPKPQLTPVNMDRGTSSELTRNETLSAVSSTTVT